MRTLEEIKALVEDKINWAEILRDLITQKFGNKRLIGVNPIYSHRDKDYYAFYLSGVAVVNGKLYATLNVCEDDDVDIINNIVFGEVNNELVKTKALKRCVKDLITDWQRTDDIFAEEFDFEKFCEINPQHQDFVVVDDFPEYQHKFEEVFANGGYFCID